MSKRIRNYEPIRTATGSIAMGKVEFRLTESLTETVHLVKLTPWKFIHRAWQHLTGDTRKDKLDKRAIMYYVMGAVQEHWYQLHNMDLPERCIKNQNERLVAALTDMEVEDVSSTTSD